MTMKKTKRKCKQPTLKTPEPVFKPQNYNIRKSFHIPLSPTEHDKLHLTARAVGLPYATWARATLLVVADMPPELQPIRMGMLPAAPFQSTQDLQVDSRQMVFESTKEVTGGKSCE